MKISVPKLSRWGTCSSWCATYSLTHSLTYSLTHSLTHSLTYSLTYLLTYSLTHLLTHSLTHSLIYLIVQVCYLWDNQKQILASECKEENVVFIAEPTAQNEYIDAAVKGNKTGKFISADGVRPSRRGYFYYAMHLSDRITHSRR